MAFYEPITTPEKKQEWITYLEEQKEFLDGLTQDTITREVMQTEDGDLMEFKRIVGAFLSTLKEEVVIIN